tara:strand:+ start:19420 stop:20694 length:1275 start_codon:yes stop_codon:yes gene_type:complete
MNNLKKYKFSDLYDIGSGISSKPEQAGHGFPFLSFSSVFNNHFLPSSLPDLMDTSEKERKTYSIKEGDVFLTRTSETLDELAMSSVAICDAPNATYSGFLKRLRPNQTDITYPKFMAFYLRSKLFRKTMTNNAIMTLRASFNEQIFSYLDLLLPELESQKNIGDLLFLLNEKIELNNKINAELEAMAKLIYDYWFVQFDFPDANGEPYKSSGGKMVYSEELKREIPECWTVDSLGDLGEFKNGVNYDKSSLGGTLCPIINVRNISASSFFIQNKDLDIVSLSQNDADNYSMNSEDILIARSGIPGATRLVSGLDKNTIFCGFAIRYQLNKSTLKLKVFFFLKDLEKSIQSGSGGTILKNVNQATLKDLLFAYPIKEDLLNSFNEIIFPLFNRINLVQEENNKLTDLRDWLLPMLMNGQVTIKVN